MSNSPPAATGIWPLSTVDRDVSSSTSGDRDHPLWGMRRSGPAPSVGGRMSLLWIIVILVAANARRIAAMLLVRRRAPEGSYFTDGDRASGVFGVLAGGFAIFAGFIIFLAFTTYDQSRSGGEAEALTVVQQFETAQLLPPAVRAPPDRGARLLRTLGRAPGVAADGGRQGRRHDQPLGDRPLPEPEAREPEDRRRAGRVRRSGSIRPPTARRAGATGSTARKASSPPRSGSSSS